ncbi:MAG TPA: histidine phosphatase family protein [Ktedonobacteraceae bacterium]|nr:histidine phosphatase family protein [Ktedonobacteraceae bacterium]
MNNTTTNTLYLVRHGENLANITNEFSYKLVDYPLTPKGVLQAEQTAEFFKAIAIDAVYASPLKRAHETGEIIARPHALPVIVLEEFREVNVGDLERMPPTEAAWKLHNQVVDEWLKGNPAARFPGGENFLELVERARRGLLNTTRGRSGQRIVIAAHGGILTAIVRSVCAGVSTDQTPLAGMHNCAITEIELTTDADHITCGVLRCWADVTHLSGKAAEPASLALEYEEASLESKKISRVL